MSADTVVGPSMASGSHTCNGNWADLPTAPPNIQSVAHFNSVALAAKSALSNNSEYLSVPNVL